MLNGQTSNICTCGAKLFARIHKGSWSQKTGVLQGKRYANLNVSITYYSKRAAWKISVY